MTTKRFIYTLILPFFTLIAVAWLTGLALFVATIGYFGEPAIDSALPSAQAIVVLTGGSERLATGLQLLTAGKGQKLLVSGVPTGLKPDQVFAKHSVPQELRDCCISLGHTADNTIGNAEETETWMKAEGFQNLRLVTAHYHMPRSMLIFQKVMPDIKITPHAVIPETVKLDGWWYRVGTASLLILEYNKYLYALLRLELGMP